MTHNTLFLRLEGPMQAWGDHHSRFVVRKTWHAPTKSGVMGILCAAMGISRQDARQHLPHFNDAVRMAVRIDRPGFRWWDYHTTGAHLRMRTAEGKLREDPLPTRREHLCDASFLVALQAPPDLIATFHNALLHPVWPPYLGRKNCPPSLPLVGRRDPAEPDCGDFPDLLHALRAIPWRRRLRDEQPPAVLQSLIEWRPDKSGQPAPSDAEVWYDVAQSFDMPAHLPRFVIPTDLSVGDARDVPVHPDPLQTPAPAPPRPRADYTNSEYQQRREERLKADHGLCVFCKAPAATVQHITYRRAGGNETIDDLRSLCRLCHDAVTMIEYGYNMGLDRINPEDPRWRDLIIRKRKEIIAFRSLETRRRRLEPEEV